MALIEIDALPQLRDPVLVVVAVGLGRRRARRRRQRSRCCRSSSSRSGRSARIDLADLMDLQQTRPTVHLVDGVVARDRVAADRRSSAGTLGRDVVLCAGPEPSLRWQAVLGELVDARQRLGVTRGVHARRDPEHGVAPPAGAACSRPAPTRSSSPRSARGAGLRRPDRRAERAAGDARRARASPRVALWAQVPHYVAGGASPPAIRAVLARLRELGGRRRSISRRSTSRPTAYVQRVEEGLADRPDVAEVIAGDRGRRRRDEPSCRAATSSPPRSNGSSATSRAASTRSASRRAAQSARRRFQ